MRYCPRRKREAERGNAEMTSKVMLSLTLPEMRASIARTAKIAETTQTSVLVKLPMCCLTLGSVAVWSEAEDSPQQPLVRLVLDTLWMHGLQADQ